MKRFLWIAILPLILATGAGFFWIKQNRNYELVQPKKGDILEAVYGLGKVKTDRRYELKLGVTSTIKNMGVREGDRVEKGAKLVDFDTTTSFRAPFAGVITLVSSFDGETVQPQIPIIRLEDLNDRYIEVSLEQESALRVKKGQKVKTVFESLRNQVLEGEVSALFPRNDEFLAHITVAQLSENILPGMTADVAIEIGKIEQALLVPLAAIHNGMVTVKRGGKKEKIKVEIGHIDGMWAELKGDILTTEDHVLMPRSQN